MRENHIEREMFEARQNLEDNLGKLVHKAREQISFRARITNLVANHMPALLGIAALAGVGLALLVPRAVTADLRAARRSPS